MTALALFSSRLRRALARYGFFGLMQRAFLSFWRRIFHNRNHVFIFNPNVRPVSAAIAFKIKRYATPDTLPSDIISSIEAHDGADLREVIGREFSRQGVLWIAFVDNAVAGYQWSRRGACIDHWFVPLAADDIVVFSTTTFVGYRGLRIAPAMMQYIAETELRKGAKMYIDCKVWNTPAHKGIERAGFELIGTFPGIG